MNTKTMLSTLALALGLAASAAHAGNESHAPDRALFCTEMSDSGFHVRACYLESRVRIDLSNEHGDTRQLRSTWVIDMKHRWSWVVDHDRHTYRSYGLSSAAATLRKTDKAAYHQAVAARREVARSLAEAHPQAGRSKWNTDESQGCVWYRFGKVMIKGLPQRFGDLCVRRRPKRLVAAFLGLVALLQRAQKAMLPFELQGVPVPNLSLPIYRKDGVIVPDHLPVHYRPRALHKPKVFRHSFRPTPLKGYFVPPMGYKKH